MPDADYLDLNQSLFREHFAQALPWTEYLETAQPQHRQRWLDALERTTVRPAEAALLGSFVRRLNVLVLSGSWCGDCVRQGPILYRIAEAAPTVELRFIDRDQYRELANVLRINGALKVPVVVFLSEDFYEVGRFGDRLLSIYRAKAERELGASCETGIVPPAADALATEVAGWVDLHEWMHLILRTAPLLRRRYGD